MQHLSRRGFRVLAVLTLCVATAFPAMNRSMPVQAQTHSWVHKHHKLVGIGAGIAAYKAAKITGKRRAASGRKLNFAQRHPMLTGIGAGLAANHIAKKHH